MVYIMRQAAWFSWTIISNNSPKIDFVERLAPIIIIGLKFDFVELKVRKLSEREKKGMEKQWRLFCPRLRRLAMMSI